jgi:serine/threonine-protein kinase
MTDLGSTTATARSGRDTTARKAAVSPGDTIGGRYVVEEMLGSGGMGVVVAARHATLGHRVAIKLLSPTAGADADAYARFTREARIIASLESEHVVRVTDFGIHTGSPYMVMDLLAGRDLQRELRERGALPVAEAVDYVIQACDGLWSTHVKGVVHRDVKLANLFLATKADCERIIKVLDFGVSKAEDGAQEDASLTRTATMIGSPLYMSPEQIRDPRRVDERADVWSLGIVLYKLLSDEAPFSGQSTNAVCASIAADPPASLRSYAPQVPHELEGVVLCCLEKRPERRYPSVAALARALVPFASAAGAALAQQLALRASDAEPRPVPALDRAPHDSATSLGFAAGAQTGNGANGATASEQWVGRSRGARTTLWVGLGLLAVAGFAAVWRARLPSAPEAATASPVTSASPIVAPAATAPAIASTPIPAVAVPVATSASAEPGLASPATVDRTREHDPRLRPKRRVVPPTPPRPTPAPSRFGGSALDDHQ